MKKLWWRQTETTGGHSELRNGGPSRFVTLTQHLAVAVFKRSARVSRKASNIGQIADYISWLKGTFPAVRHFATREELWSVMLIRASSEAIRGVEFGVAWGYGTNWWLTHLSDEHLRWDGFDRFTGLPREWRDMDEGSFNAGGRPPDISDGRVTWHVGDLEDHIDALLFDRTVDKQLLILFDLDIYEPSAVAWEHVKPFLRPGDLLYFDEAFDADERRLLRESVLPSGQFELVGATPMALALCVRAMSGPEN